MKASMSNNQEGPEVLQPWLEGVEGDAGKALITSTKRYIRVVAGPGSGKTFGLKRRVRRLVEGDKVQPDEIFVGTFTRAIASELAAALAPAVGGEDTPKPKVSTLHAQAAEMLRNDLTAAPGRKFRFLLAHEESAMLYDIATSVPEIEDDNDRRKELRKVQSYWSGAGDLTDDKFRGAMDNWLREHGGMLIGEVVYLALAALNNGDLPTGRFKHVVVDEYQDLTLAEQQLIEKLRTDEGSLVVLGDDDQSIYGFRYNNPDGITGFSTGRDPAQFHSINIPENRRCGEVIVTLANRMMAAAGSKKPPMISKRGELGQLDILYWDNVDDEIAGLAAYVNTKKNEKFLILVPRRFIGYKLRDLIGSDASTSFHEEVLESHLVRERFALAALFADPDDRVAVRAWLGLDGSTPKPADKRNSVAVASLSGYTRTGTALLEAIAAKSILPKGEGAKSVTTRAERFVAEKAALPPLLEDAIKYLFDPPLATQIDDAEKQAAAKNDLQLLRDAALQFTKRKGSTLASILEQLRYRIATRIPLLEDEEETRVRIMTLHGSKGLEADVIIAAGLADQILPGKPDKTPDETTAKEAEQRRLLYVAVTRAKKHLIMSRPRLVPFGVAMSENIRVDAHTVTQLRGTKVVKLSATRFIPNGYTAQFGPTWLKKNGV